MSLINKILLFCFTGAVTIPLENLNPSYEMVNWHQLTNFSRMTWEKWLKWWITLWYTALWHKYSIYFFFTSFVHTILTNTFIYSIERIKKWYFQRFIMKYFLRVFSNQSWLFWPLWYCNIVSSLIFEMWTRHNKMN